MNVHADEHCIHLVESDIAVKLLALLDRNPVDTGSPITHHAVLSALRNLAIPGLLCIYIYRAHQKVDP